MLKIPSMVQSKAVISAIDLKLYTHLLIILRVTGHWVTAD